MSDKVWVGDLFEHIGYHSLDELENACRRARQAEAAGTWKDFSVELASTDMYSDKEYPYLIGKRPETDLEQKQRLALEADRQRLREERERIEYERLKSKFENGGVK
jgi:hypothetical protein